ncbi:hypothetical protein CU097_015400 [Rhizopus azygosporus]|uniref:Rhomboid-type serine protease n=2 Tax=Rhizopus TaxID=4842 RepID=A0A367KG24_RHIAZ|nr:rhomboid-domain-containing protein [Rhizopus microsporus]RCI01127.1 hypothetical protein CU097_015400 [Rhizopus azygosporus]
MSEQAALEELVKKRRARHRRQLSHVQFVKRTQRTEKCPPSLIIPIEQQQEEQSPEEENNKDECNILRYISIGPSTENDHWPLFSWLWLVILIILFSGELLLNRQTSGEFFELYPLNSMIGPSVETMIQTGARFVPCMKPVSAMPTGQRYICLDTTLMNETLSLLAPSSPALFNTSCSLEDICGMIPFRLPGVPDQVVRFATPLALHTGIIHLFLDGAILLIISVKLEQAINSLRTSLLFICSGIFGHALGANFAEPLTVYLGCSSSLFGYLGYLYIDLLVHWKSTKKRLQRFVKLFLVTFVCFLLGLLPGVDSYSHLGGLASGIILAFFLMPIKEKAPDLKKRIIVYFVRLCSLCIYGILLGILIRRFTIIQ